MSDSFSGLIWITVGLWLGVAAELAYSVRRKRRRERVSKAWLRAARADADERESRRFHKELNDLTGG